MYTVTIIPNHHPNLVAINAEFPYNLLLDGDGNPLGQAELLKNITLMTKPILAWSIKSEDRRAASIGPRVSAYPIVPNTHLDRLAEPHFIIFDNVTGVWTVRQCSGEDSGVGKNSLVKWMLEVGRCSRHLAWLANPWHLKPTDQLYVDSWVPNAQQKTEKEKNSDKI